MGQCFPVPEDANLRRQMLRHARNHERIYNMYNLPWRVRPGPPFTIGPAALLRVLPNRVMQYCTACMHVAPERAWRADC